MDCETYRERLLADPARAGNDLAAHERDCPACRAYALRARRAESLIREALRFDTAAVGRTVAAGRAGPRGAQLWWPGLAAGVVAALALWFGFGVGRPAEAGTLAAAALAHWDHEPESWAVSEAGVSARELEHVLAGQATVDFAAIGRVTYARTCRVAGQWMSHLVVQSDAGPVMLLLIPAQQVDAAVPLRLPEQGLGGSLLPSGPGSIVVLGPDTPALAPLARRVAASVDWSI